MSARNNHDELSADEDLDQPAPETGITPARPENPAGPPAETPAGDVNLEDAFSKLFKSSVSGTGEEELLRIASNYSLQISAAQIRCLLYLEYRAKQFDELSQVAKGPEKIKYDFIRRGLRDFVSRWLELKQHNNSDVFVMRALDSISLRKFINENTLKVNIEK